MLFDSITVLKLSLLHGYKYLYNSFAKSLATLFFVCIGEFLVEHILKIKKNFPKI
jgi:hypothetical protein